MFNLIVNLGHSFTYNAFTKMMSHACSSRISHISNWPRPDVIQRTFLPNPYTNTRWSQWRVSYTTASFRFRTGEFNRPWPYSSSFPALFYSRFALDYTTEACAWRHSCAIARSTFSIHADANSPDDRPQMLRDGAIRVLAHAQIDLRVTVVDFSRRRSKARSLLARRCGLTRDVLP